MTTEREYLLLELLARIQSGKPIPTAYLERLKAIAKLLPEEVWTHDIQGSSLKV